MNVHKSINHNIMLWNVLMKYINLWCCKREFQKYKLLVGKTILTQFSQWSVVNFSNLMFSICLPNTVIKF